MELSKYTINTNPSSMTIKPLLKITPINLTRASININIASINIIGF